MFDPTAFDNMKVVIEGALYDLDLEGEIEIIDRNDLMNMAKMSRSFDVCFRLADKFPHKGTAKMEIESKLNNLASELMQNEHLKSQQGCHLRLNFFHKGIINEDYLDRIKQILVEIWGANRKIIHSVTLIPPETTANHTITIEFDRIVGEEQLDDIIEMIDFMVITLQKLHEEVPGV
ncbi:hypothetical protein [Bacillus sp. MRMR6]|uniref:hypothetical protein n=1 Tax=Bacillus sp. MRMR6 TaxID=1928617 RepID=UPI000950EE4D|nr:hypothetical protein [Bacillus sp. MRMR6]OLS37755.1 hypothetical protein BTR25_15690 [Bacillus sp. MRMR6]